MCCGRWSAGCHFRSIRRRPIDMNHPPGSIRRRFASLRSDCDCLLDVETFAKHAISVLAPLPSHLTVPVSEPPPDFCTYRRFIILHYLSLAQDSNQTPAIHGQRLRSRLAAQTIRQQKFQHYRRRRLSPQKSSSCSSPPNTQLQAKTRKRQRSKRTPPSTKRPKNARRRHSSLAPPLIHQPQHPTNNPISEKPRSPSRRTSPQQSLLPAPTLHLGRNPLP